MSKGNLHAVGSFFEYRLSALGELLEHARNEKAALKKAKAYAKRLGVVVTIETWEPTRKVHYDDQNGKCYVRQGTDIQEI